ncbi:MAG: class I SAM-dependent methyltransferase [Actinomycetota bacterium]|nr:class I SAM-dependent methyltransferase [Actinomycetota bacterium]
MRRYQASTIELDRAEQQWWSDHGDLEEDYCWVQPPWEQRFLRHRYLRAITEVVNRDSTVLEMGCGTGWLSLLLARLGVESVVGIDFSEEQISRARASARAAGLQRRAQFVIAGDDDHRIAHQVYDVVVMHAFLHHLSSQEIERSLAEAASRLDPGGRLVVVEPLNDPHGPTVEPRALHLSRTLEGLPRRLHERGLRRMSPEEVMVRSRLSTRNVASSPFGPSPKELPFEREELRLLLSQHFDVVATRPALCMSHLVAQELLVAGLSQPRASRMARRPILGLARALDRRFMAGTAPRPRTVWSFEVFVCKRRAP